MPNRIEARSAKAALTNATGRLPLLRLFSTPLIAPGRGAPAQFPGSHQNARLCDIKMSPRQPTQPRRFHTSL